MADGYSHHHFMMDALKMADKALGLREVPVGCIIVYKGDIVASGYNDVNRTKNATRHAEMIAIDKLRSWCTDNDLIPDNVFPECTLYVTTEPCIMCAAALRIVKVTNVYYGCSNQRFGGCGSRLDVHTKNFISVNKKEIDCVKNHGMLSKESDHSYQASQCDVSTQKKRKKYDNFGNENVSITAQSENTKADKFLSEETYICRDPVLKSSGKTGETDVNYGELLNCTPDILPNQSIALLKQFYGGENPNAPNPMDKSSRKK